MCNFGETMHTPRSRPITLTFPGAAETLELGLVTRDRVWLSLVLKAWRSIKGANMLSNVSVGCTVGVVGFGKKLIDLGRWGKKNRWGIRWKLFGDEYCVCKASKICLPTYTLLGAANSIETLWVLKHQIYEVLWTVEVFGHQLFISNVSLSHAICFQVLYLKFLPARFLSSDLTTSQWIHLNFWCPSRWLTLSFATNDPHWNQQFSPKNGWLGGPILPSACWKVAPVA